MIFHQTTEPFEYKAIVSVRIEQSGQTKLQDEYKVALCFGTQLNVFNHPDYLKRSVITYLPICIRGFQFKDVIDNHGDQ